MNRKQFLFLTTTLLGVSKQLMGRNPLNPELLYFQDDGIVPNNKLPLLMYKNAFTARGEKGAKWLENKFISNNWSNNWRNGIFSFQHYHSITHEVLGIYNGEVTVLLGGEQGTKVDVKAGTIIIIPAGVGHKNLGDDKLGVVGAYPNGMPVDIIRCEPDDRPQTDKNIAVVPLPDQDPLLGSNSGLISIWNKFS